MTSTEKQRLACKKYYEAHKHDGRFAYKRKPPEQKKAENVRYRAKAAERKREEARWTQLSDALNCFYQTV